MLSFLPLFPLSTVVFPSETLNLHIFEPRYRQLISECIENATTFGIPPFLDNRLLGYGTELKVIALKKRYEDGRMDIQTKGIRAFRMLDFENPAKGKLYAGGNVAFVPFVSDFAINPHLLVLVEEFYDLLAIPKIQLADTSQPFSFLIGHKIGLSQANEYKLLTIESEAKRQGYLLHHLESILPTLREVERTKQRIAMNGHFQNFDPLSF